MELRKKMKGFFSLTRKANSGFTLVELIVVIAILAILAGVGVPAYSGYVTKTNITADQQLLADVEHALHLAFYSDPDFKPGSVMICAAQNPLAENTSLENALKATFGDDLSAVRLKYDGWTSEYSESSFYGKETDLLAQVDTMTDLLQDAISENQALVGASFGSYLEGKGIDATDSAKVADAAVLYVAQNTANLTPEQRAAYTECLASFPQTGSSTFTSTFTNIYGGVNVTSVTALYAFAEAYFQYEAGKGQTSGLTALREGVANVEASDTETALNNLMTAIGNAMANYTPALAEAYFTPGADGSSCQAIKDGDAYLDIMDKVSSNQDMFTGNLGQENAFSTIGANLFLAYVDGAAFVKTEILEDGSLNVILPELDK